MRFFLVILFIFYASLSFSQLDLVFEWVEGIKSGARVEDIEIEDNIVWIASENGIYVYDTDNDSLSQTIFNEDALIVKVSESGSIFSAFSSKNLFYNEDNLVDAETNFGELLDDDFKFSDIEVYDNELWVGSNRGILIFNLTTNELVDHYTINNSLLRSEDISFIVYSPNNEKLYVGTADGVLEIKNRNKEWMLEYEGQKMIAATENKDGLWLLSDVELYLMIKGREYPQGIKEGLYEGIVNDIALDKDNNLHIASDILTRFDPYQDRIDAYDEEFGSIASKYLSLAFDKQGALWIGTDDAGLFKLHGF